MRLPAFFLTMMLGATAWCLPFSVVPEAIDFGMVYQGQLKTQNLVLRLTEDGHEDTVTLVDISCDSREVEVSASAEFPLELQRDMTVEVRFLPRVVLGTYQKALHIRYLLADTPKEKPILMAIPLQAQVKPYYMVSPPQLVVNKAVVGQKVTKTLYVESNDRSPFTLQEATWDIETPNRGVIESVTIRSISPFRKAVTVTLLAQEKGRIFGTISLPTGNKAFERITIDLLARFVGYITPDQWDIPFRSVDIIKHQDEAIEKQLVLRAPKGYTLTIGEMSDPSGRLTFEILEISDNMAAIAVRLQVNTVQEDFFGRFTIQAGANDIAETLTITYHGKVFR